jgi:DNA-binding MarR family transcriptional regulator
MNEAAHALAIALRAAYLTMHRRADAHFARHGVTADQFVLLNILAQESEVTQQTLVARASSDPNTVRAMLLLLEGRSLVSRERHPLDGRARSVSLTKKGRKLHQRLMSASQSFLARLVADYRPDELATLLDLLGRIPTAMVGRDGAPVRRSGSASEADVIGAS